MIANQPNSNQVHVDKPKDDFGDTGTFVSQLPASVSAPTDIFAGALGLTPKTSEGEVKDFLARPQIFETGVFQVSDTTATVLVNKPMHNYISQLYAEKLKGHFALKYDAKFTLEVSADRFHVGRYILAHLPAFAYNAPDTYDMWATTHSATMTQMTQLPHVEIDLAAEKKVELYVPFRYISPFIPYGPGGGNNNAELGRIILRPYSALQAGSSGETTATYNLWVSLHNVEFLGTADYQSSSEEEAKSVDKGPISGPLTSITKVLSAVSSVPVVGQYAKPASWVTEALARAAKSFGWSSPINQSGQTAIQNMPNGYAGVTDVARVVQPLSLSMNNAITPDTRVFGKEVDEMSLDYIKGIYAYYGSMTWNVTATRGTKLLTTWINPCYLAKTHTSRSGAALTSMTPMGYIASRFKFWRGGIKLKFKLVKNSFYTGKLLVAWAPWDWAFDISTTNTIDGSYFKFRQIIDVSAGNEFEVVVPYVSTRMHKSVYPRRNFGDLSDKTVYYNDFSNGFLQVFVLDKLKAPTMCPTTIEILVEAAGDDDFEVSCPMENTYFHPDGTSNQGIQPYYTALYQCGVEYDAPDDDPICGYAEYEMDDTKIPSISTYRLGDVKPLSHETRVSVAAHAAGEKITSLRQLLKRYSGSGDFSISSALTPRIYCQHMFEMPNYDAYNGSSWVSVPINTYVSDVNYFAHLYGMMNGSLNFRFWLPATGSSYSSFARQQFVATLANNWLSTKDGPQLTNKTAGICVSGATPTDCDPGCNSINRPHAYAVVSLNECLEFSIPYYSRTTAFSMQGIVRQQGEGNVPWPDNLVRTNQVQRMPGVPDICAIVKVNTASAVTVFVNVEVALGDDASFGYFVSTVPLSTGGLPQQFPDPPP